MTKIHFKSNNMQDNLTDLEYSQLIWQITKCKYSFAITEGRWLGSADKFTRKGECYQLMPDTINGQAFFDWYCDKRPYNQFYPLKQDCVLQFLKYWYEWKATLKN